MTNKEKIKKDIAISFDFVEQILNNPVMLDKIPSGSLIRFLDTENENREKKVDKGKKQYVRVRKQFEVL